MRTRHAMTLVEVIIATALFSAMLVMLMESMIHLRGMASTVDDMDILEEQATNARRAITKDLANSGWFYNLPGANGKKYYPQIHVAEQEDWQAGDIAPAPQVVIPLYNAVTNMVVEQTFTATVSLNRSTILGDALVFTRLQPEGQPLSDTPASMTAAIVDFNQQPPLRLDEYPHARAIQSLVINPLGTDQPELTSVVWETTPAIAADGDGLSAIELFDDAKVRLFCYRVVPDPQTGRGNLVRSYSNPDSGDRNGSDAWITDQIIATDVVSMRIYNYEMSTWYTGTMEARDFSTSSAAGLSNNQLRFVIQFARNLGQVDAQTAIDLEDRGGTSVSREANRSSTMKTVEFTIGLRSITNALDQ